MDLKELKLTKRRSAILDDLGIKTVEELLMYYPFRYEENICKPFKEWEINDTVIFGAILLSQPSTFRYGKRSMTRFKVLYDDKELNITIFNRPWLKVQGDKIVIKGKYDGASKVTALNYSFHDIEDEIGIKAIYPLKENIRQSDIQAMIKKGLEIYRSEDILPLSLKNKYQLMDLNEALKEIHLPSSKDKLKKAITRLKYDEFLRFYSTLKMLKDSNETSSKAKKIDLNAIDILIHNLPFKLTSDQQKCVDDILKDLASPYMTTRLIQGDVGSGKTIVAAIALYASVKAGYQGALMAPTEILAKQHYQSLKAILKDINIVMLSSDTKKDTEIKKMIEDNKAQIIIGTHALFSDDVIYHNLGLVIADEQHRFGVKQRRKLKEKGQDVDLLLMSATPIPRTLASSIYGDMDVSTIETMPIGRKGCDTYLLKSNSIVSIMDEIKKTMASGKQVYIITAAIEHSDAIKVKDATNLYNSLLEVMKPYRLGLLHGKMNQELKTATMNAFINHEIDILVSTTVVEVGVNVKNATMMIIYDADRFGLSQLHQLRGRIQRGDDKGTCYLLTDSKDENILKRLNVLVNSNDGFYIASEDLKLRGPGDILGTRQSGLPPFILGDLIADTKFIEVCKKDANEIIERSSEVEFQNYYAKIKSLAILNNID